MGENTPIERDDLMERFIRQLVSYDQQGQKMVREAQSLSRQTLEHMDAEKRELYEEYAQRAEHKLEYYREQAEAEKREAVATLRENHTRQSERLREQFAQKQDAWVTEMAARCLGR